MSGVGKEKISGENMEDKKADISKMLDDFQELEDFIKSNDTVSKTTLDDLSYELSGGFRAMEDRINSLENSVNEEFYKVKDRLRGIDSALAIGGLGVIGILIYIVVKLN